MARRFAAAAALALIAGGCGGDSSPSDRESVLKLYDDLTAYASTQDYEGFCDRSTQRFARAAAYTGSAKTCEKGLQDNAGTLPTRRLTKLTVAGDRATGDFRDMAGVVGHIKFAKQDGEWKVDGLTYIVSKPSFPTREKPEPIEPGDLHTTEGREIARVLSAFYTGLQDQDTALLCDNITPDARKKVIAIGSIQDAKTCQTAYTKIFDQLRFHYTETPKVVRVTISGKKARAITMFGSNEVKAPLKQIGTAWKVDSIG